MFGGAAPPRQRPFLQRRLGMLRRRRLSLDHLTPMGENESANSVDTLVEIECADQRLDRVGGDIVAVAAAVVARLRAETDERGDRKSTRLNSSHKCASRMPSSA